jgi:hypothetical protein
MTHRGNTPGENYESLELLTKPCANTGHSNVIINTELHTEANTREETYPGVKRGVTHPAEKTHQQHSKADYGRTWPDYTHRQSRNNVIPTRRTQAVQHTGDETTDRRGD